MRKTLSGDWEKSEKEPVDTFHRHDQIAGIIEVLVQMGEHHGVVLELPEAGLFERDSVRAQYPRVFVSGAIGYDRFEEQGALSNAVEMVREAANIVGDSNPIVREAIEELANWLRDSLVDEIKENSEVTQ